MNSAFARAYVPSRALLRALRQPHPPPCPFARPLARSAAGQSSQRQFHAATRLQRRSKKEARHDDGPEVTTEKNRIVVHPDRRGGKRLEYEMSPFETEEDLDALEAPISEEAVNHPGAPEIWFSEQDLDKGTPPQLVSKIATPEDRRRERELQLMFQEHERNPDYDDADLKRRVIDDLIKHPNFAHLKGQLQTLRKTVRSKPEMEDMKRRMDAGEEVYLTDEMRKNFAPLKQKMGHEVRSATQQALQDLLDDPDLEGPTHDKLRELQRKLPDTDNLTDPAFVQTLDKIQAELDGNEKFQQKMAALEADEEYAAEEEKKGPRLASGLGPAGAGVDNAEAKLARLKENSEHGPEHRQEIDQLLVHMRDMMKLLGADPALQKDLDDYVSEDPIKQARAQVEAEQGDGTEDREPSVDELSSELKRLATSKLERTEAEKNLDPETAAKVDRIMQDPKLMERVMMITKALQQAHEMRKRDLTQVDTASAPDPTTLPVSDTATVGERISMAKNDPEHVAALARLRVHLTPPFHVAPALRQFNQAIELAYVASNDDVRRILWRAYSKARLLPTFIQNVGDEAWDLVYYSQAVTWKSNQNRVEHLKTVLGDLRSLGREGPPTHPSTLAKGEA